MTERSQPDVILLGSRGFLGSRIAAALERPPISVEIPRIATLEDLSATRIVLAEALDRHPDAVIVNAVGVRQGPGDLLDLVNARLTEVLVEVAASTGARLIHFGSAAEIVRAEAVREDDSAAARQALGYGDSKRRGTEACLRYEGATVLRVFNLHGLPHQDSAGVHALCRAVRGANERPPVMIPLYDTTRDYVDWHTVVSATVAAIDGRHAGLIEVCSGVGVSVAEIVEGLPAETRDALEARLVPSEWFGPVVGPAPVGCDLTSVRNEVVHALQQEVMECASS